MMAYAPNPGRLPDACVIESDSGTQYRSVHVQLFGGYCTRKAGAAPWPSKGARGGETNWRISQPPHPYEIKEWEIA